MDIHIDFVNKSVMVNMKQLEKDFPVRLHNAVYAAVEQGRSEVVKSLTSGKYEIKTDTGRLRDSFEAEVQNRGTEVRGILRSGGVKYAAIHEFGGDIYPVKANALKFRLRSGQWITTKHVKMPERRYVKRSILDNQEKILRVFANALMKDIIK